MPSPNTLRPLVTVIGATGTGKSQLAVDLARSLDGEIINADAMQMYEGLPIITNKMPIHERCGISHHFLGTVPRESEIRVGQWEGGVRNLIDEVRGRGKLPIIVGGTHYYIQALLYPRNLLDEETAEGETDAPSSEELARKHPILNAPAPHMLEELQSIDPVMARRWHPNDYRKIRRSLEIYYINGCTPASEVYRRQKLADQQKLATVDRFRNLIFWVHAEPEVLKQRLRGRVDTMVTQGLFDEIQDLWDHYQVLVDRGEKVDLERGVWQSIGFKEFLPYLHALREGIDGEKLEELKREGLERMKFSTIRYARTQVKWIRIKLMNAIREANEYDEHGEAMGGNASNSEDTPSTSTAGSVALTQKPTQPSNILYLLDSSNASLFTDTVSSPAISIAQSFLPSHSGKPLPDPQSMSALAAEFLTPKREYDLANRMDLWVKKTCEVCKITTVDVDSWRKHEESRKHKKAMKGRMKYEEGLMWKEKREREAREKEESGGGEVEVEVEVEVTQDRVEHAQETEA